MGPGKMSRPPDLEGSLARAHEVTPDLGGLHGPGQEALPDQGGLIVRQKKHSQIWRDSSPGPKVQVWEDFSGTGGQSSHICEAFLPVPKTKEPRRIWKDC